MPESVSDAMSGPAQKRSSVRSAVLLAVVLVALALAVIEWLVGWRAVAELAGQLSVPAWLAFAAAMLVSYVLRAARLYFYLDELRGRFFDTLRLSVLHNAANNLLPMRTGEIAFPVLAKRFFDLPVTRTISVLGWFRLLDAVVLGLAALALAAFGAGRSGAPGLGGPLLVLSLLGLSLAPGLLAWLLHRAGRFTGRLPGKLARIVELAAAGLPQSTAHYLRDYGWTLANWGLKLAVLAAVFLALLPAGSPPAAAIGALAGEVSGLLPTIAPAGLGTYEAAVVATVAPLGVALRDALAAAVALHLAILLASILAALLMSGPFASAVLGAVRKSGRGPENDT